MVSTATSQAIAQIFLSFPAGRIYPNAGFALASFTLNAIGARVKIITSPKPGGSDQYRYRIFQGRGWDSRPIVVGRKVIFPPLLVYKLDAPAPYRWPKSDMAGVALYQGYKPGDVA